MQSKRLHKTAFFAARPQLQWGGWDFFAAADCFRRLGRSLAGDSLPGVSPQFCGHKRFAGVIFGKTARSVM